MTSNRPTSAPADRRLHQIGDSFVAEDLQQMQMARRYNEWLFELVAPHVGTRVLEVGAGIGTMTSRLLERAEYVCGLEPNDWCFGELMKTHGARPHFEGRAWSVETCDLEFLRARRFDTVVCVNVLEHVEDDRAALRFFRSILASPGARLVLLVPATPAAFGPIDAALGHHRRYSRRLLRTRLEETGFTPRHLRYSNLIGLAGWFYNARLRSIHAQSDRQIWIFDRLIVPWYSVLDRLVPPPIGLSLISCAT